MTATLVLDVSGSAEFIMDRHEADFVKQALLESEFVVVPSLYRYEVKNLFWKYHVFHDVLLPRCQSALNSSLELPDEFISGDELLQESFKNACLSEHVGYDIFYLVTAERTNASLVTFDDNLRELATEQDVKVLPSY